jgi:hypothetical protein
MGREKRLRKLKMQSRRRRLCDTVIVRVSKGYYRKVITQPLTEQLKFIGKTLVLPESILKTKGTNYYEKE